MFTGYLTLFACHGRCEDLRIGTTVFHTHVGALASGRYINKKAGRKIKRVAVIDHHFHVVNAEEAKS